MGVWSRLWSRYETDPDLFIIAFLTRPLKLLLRRVLPVRAAEKTQIKEGPEQQQQRSRWQSSSSTRQHLRQARASRASTSAHSAVRAGTGEAGSGLSLVAKGPPSSAAQPWGDEKRSALARSRGRSGPRPVEGGAYFLEQPPSLGGLSGPRHVGGAGSAHAGMLPNGSPGPLSHGWGIQPQPSSGRQRVLQSNSMPAHSGERRAAQAVAGEGAHLAGAQEGPPLLVPRRRVRKLAATSVVVANSDAGCSGADAPVAVPRGALSARRPKALEAGGFGDTHQPTILSPIDEATRKTAAQPGTAWRAARRKKMGSLAIGLGTAAAEKSSTGAAARGGRLSSDERASVLSGARLRRPSVDETSGASSGNSIGHNERRRRRVSVNSSGISQDVHREGTTRSVLRGSGYAASGSSDRPLLAKSGPRPQMAPSARPSDRPGGKSGMHRGLSSPHASAGVSRRLRVQRTAIDSHPTGGSTTVGCCGGVAIREAPTPEVDSQAAESYERVLADVGRLRSKKLVRPGAHAAGEVLRLSGRDTSPLAHRRMYCSVIPFLAVFSPAGHRGADPRRVGR